MPPPQRQPLINFLYERLTILLAGSIALLITATGSTLAQTDIQTAPTNSMAAPAVPSFSASAATAAASSSQLAETTNGPVLAAAALRAATASTQISLQQPVRQPAQLTLQNGRAVSQNAPFAASFANDIQASGAVALTTPSGQRIKATIYGLAYVDFPSGKSALIARLKSSSGQLISGSKLLFRDAFDSGITADVEYDLDPSGHSIEQLVVLRRKIPGPDSFGMPGTSRLAVITAFDAPIPKRIP